MPAAFAYDEIPYECLPIPQSHPDRLAVLGRLYGLEPAALDRCRVLELGCGNGANLIPMAATMPRGRFVGVDLARTSVAQAQQTCRALALGNITFHQTDIRELDFGQGEFDYIIAHGVYSWVPAEVRERLMAVAGRHLAPNGLAYISYNTYPGCHLRRIVRDMMLYHTSELGEPDLKIAEARALVDFLASAEPRTAALKDELRELQSRSVPAVFHDDLSEVNEPVYFHQFAAHARAHGLQFLAEAEFASMQDGAFRPEVADTLRALAQGDVVRKQQYIDFIKCRRFRQTILCRDSFALPPEPLPAAIERLWAASAAVPGSAVPEVSSDAEESFAAPGGASIKTTLPLAKAAMAILAKSWPAAVPFAGLLEESVRLAGGRAADGAPALLRDLLLRTFSTGLIELHAGALPLTTEVSERPRAFSLARLEAGAGPLVTTLRHITVAIEDRLALRLITLLDGSRDRAALTGALGAPGEIRLEDLERNLAKLARVALLEG